MTQEQMDALKAYYSIPTTDKVQPNFEDVKTVADNIIKVSTLADAILDSLFQTVNDNIDDIKTNATQSANITILASIKDILTSLVNDKTTLDSLYADKPTLDGLYALKNKIDSLFVDKIKLDSLYADKITLDAIYSKLSEITTAVANIIDIQNAASNANIATSKALETKGFRDEAEGFKNQAQAIAGGEVLASVVKFTDNSSLEEYKTIQANNLNLKVNISDVVNNLNSIDINKPLAANQGKVLDNKIDTIIPQIGSITKDMIGFVDSLTTTISANPITREVKLTVDLPTTVYHHGNPITLTGSYSLILDAVSGGRYIRLNTETMELEDIGEYPTFEDDLLVTYIYYNHDKQKIIIRGNERHKASTDTQWHKTQHIDVGAVWRSGGAVSYTLDDDTNTALSLSSPIKIVDEDLEHIITNSASGGADYTQPLNLALLETMYVDDLGFYNTSSGSTNPYMYSTSGAVYNKIVDGLGSLVTVPSGKYLCYWLLGTNDAVSPIKMLLGTNYYDTVADAEVEVFEDYGLPMPEIVPMYKIIINVDDANTGNDAHVKIAKVNVIIERQLSQNKTFTTNSHDKLIGKDLPNQHPIDSITGLKNELYVLDSKPTGFKNLIINGCLRVKWNEDAIDAVAGKYNIPRWYYDGTNYIQFVENKNVILSGVYTLSWVGTATAVVNGISVANGGQVTLTANTQVEVKFDSKDFIFVQLEFGNKKTNFEFRFYHQEEFFCKRYVVKYTLEVGQVSGLGMCQNSTNAFMDFQFQPMRTAPSVSTNGGVYLIRGNITTLVTGVVARHSFGSGRYSVAISTAGNLVAGEAVMFYAFGTNAHIYFDSEIYPI